MKEINQVAALCTKFLFNLIGSPWRSIAYAMNWRAGTKAGLNSTLKEALPGCVNVSQQRAGEGQCLRSPAGVQGIFLPLSTEASFLCACLHCWHQAP